MPQPTYVTPIPACGATTHSVIGRCGRDAGHDGPHRSTGATFEATWTENPPPPPPPERPAPAPDATPAHAHPQGPGHPDVCHDARQHAEESRRKFLRGDDR